MVTFDTTSSRAPTNHKLFMTNPCEKTGPSFSPATNPPAFSNLVGSTEPPRSPCQRPRVRVCVGCFATKLWKHAREKFSISKSFQPEEDWTPCCWGFFGFTCPRKTPKATSNALFFLHMMLSGTLSSQTTDRYIIATQHAQSAWQGHAFEILIVICTKSQTLQTVRQGHPYQTLVEVGFQKSNSADC